ADSRIALALRRGLAPVALGFMLASCWLLLNSAAQDWRHYALAILAFGLALRSKLSPLWLLGAGAVLGVAGVV
ncbi:MAG: chromate transporter, partial [Betaproteobacteria bacterium]